MPNDENTQTTQQNGNPMVDSNVSANSGNSDDFDFSFDSDFGSSVSNNQNQVVGQGRTGMFLTPDEEAEKEELQNSGQAVPAGQESNSDEDPALSANNGSYFPNVNINNNVTTNDNAEVNEDNIGNISFDQDNDSQNDKFDDKIENLISFDDDSSQDPNIDADNSNTDDSGIDTSTDETVLENREETVDGGDDFGEKPLENQSLNNEEAAAQNVNLDSTDISETTDAPETTDVPETPEDVESVDGGNTSQGDDWLQQEDKKVEETFGGENTENQNIQVNESPADVVQNVENLLNNTTPDGENNLGQNNLDVNDNVSNNDMPLPDGLGQQTDLEKTESNYVPNEADFSAMSNLLNSSSAGQVDLRNVNTDVTTEPENNFSLGSDISALNNVTLQQDQGNGIDVAADNTFQDAVSIAQDSVDTVDNIANSVDNTVNTVDNMVNSVDNTVNTVDNMVNTAVDTVDMQNLQTDVSNEQNSIGINTQETVLDNSNIMGSDMIGNQPVQMDMQAPMAQDAANQSIDLNSIGALGGSESLNVNTVGAVENQGMPLDAIIDKEIQDMHIQPQNIDQTNNAGVANMAQVQPQNVQVQGQNKRKKQSGFVVLGIFGGIIVLGALGYFVVSKMFPDKFNIKNLVGGDTVVEYITGNEPTGDVENNNQIDGNVGTSNDDVDNSGQGDQNDGGVVEDNLGSDGNSVEGQESNVEGSDTTQDGEDIDPNSLAGLLLSDDNGSGDNQNYVNNPENNGLVDSGNSIDNNTGTTGDDFDPFSQIDGVLTSEPSDSDKLNDYISKGTYYKELGVSQNDKKMERYGDYIALTAQEELSKLEKGEEIDNSIFGKFDEILESLK